jgi:hypothetical protein
MESAKNEDAQQPLVLARQEEGRTIYTRGEWELSVWQDLGDEEPRVLDVDVARVLGFKQPRQIRELIERIWPEGQRPDWRRTVRRQPVGPKGGGTREYSVNAYWLTEAQVLKVCARSETDVAEAILDDMIATYLAVRSYQRGIPTANPALRPVKPPQESLAERVRAAERKEFAFSSFVHRARRKGDDRPRHEMREEFVLTYRPRSAPRPTPLTITEEDRFLRESAVQRTMFASGRANFVAELREEFEDAGPSDSITPLDPLFDALEAPGPRTMRDATALVEIVGDAILRRWRRTIEESGRVAASMAPISRENRALFRRNHKALRRYLHQLACLVEELPRAIEGKDDTDASLH